MRYAPALAVLLTVSAAALCAQENVIPSFTSGTEAVYLDVAVLKKHKQLAAEDFTVSEEGYPQKLTFFSGTPVPMDIALLLDISASMYETRLEVLDAANRLINLVGTGSTMEILTFGDHVSRIAEWSDDKKFLRSRLQDSKPQNFTILWEGIYTVLRTEMEKLPVNAAHPRRRVLVIVTDGIENGSRIEVGTQENPHVGTLWNEVRHSQTSIFVVVIRPSAGLMYNNRDRYDESIYLLKNMCAESGGIMEESQKLMYLDYLMGKIAEQLTSAYTLGWTSTAIDNKGWRHLDVHVRGIPSDKLRYRTGYQVSVHP